MKSHDKKVWLEYYVPLFQGIKKFELRKNDCDYQEGDLVTLRAWDNKKEQYMGSSFQIKIKYIIHGPKFGLKDGYCIFNW